MTSIQLNEKAYQEQFPPHKREKALLQALDIRKFEIELYWKRGTYFWAFIALAFGGYFAVPKTETINVYVVTCVGLLFSLAWYMVNRASGAWQRNWESHVDLLEDEVMGPLHKTHVNRNTYKWYHLADSYAFSPSRINNLLALGVTVIWLLLLLRTLAIACGVNIPDFWQAVVITMFVAVMLFVLIKGGLPKGMVHEHFVIKNNAKIIS